MLLVRRPNRFRVLIIGRANAGKTTILQALCGTDEQPEVYDRKGHKVETGSFRATFRSIRNKVTGRDSNTILSPSSTRGLHRIDHSLIFPSNQRYVFHDSRGFESGATDELELVRDFIRTRAGGNDLNEQLHAIWYCFPTDGNRVITAAEQEFFGKIDTGRVPVIAVFTKFDALDSAAFKTLEAGGLSFNDAKQGASAYAEELFETTHLPLIQHQPHPPKGVVYLRSMQDKGLASHSQKGISDLMEKTFTSLDDNALKLLLILVQNSNIKLCMKAAVESGTIIGAAKALENLRQNSHFQPDAHFFWEIFKWFPYIHFPSGLTNKGEIEKNEYPVSEYGCYKNHYEEFQACDQQGGFSKGYGNIKQMAYAAHEVKNALTPLPPSIACPHHPSLEALLIGLALITAAANCFWRQLGETHPSRIAHALKLYATSSVSDSVKAAVLEAFPNPINSYTIHACNTKLLQIVMENHTDVGKLGIYDPVVE